MTSVSGYNVLATPCCGAKYKNVSYASINLRGRQTWSDGFWIAPLYRPTFPVCKCMACGSLFLTGDGVAVGYIDFDDKSASAVGDDLPWVPAMTHDQIVSAVLVDPMDCYPSAEVELSVRLAFWQQLNHPFRALQLGRRKEIRPEQSLLVGRPCPDDAACADDDDAVARFRQSKMSRLLPWGELSDTDIDALIEDNLRLLLPLLGALEPDSHLLIGEAHRALGQIDKAVGHFQHETGQKGQKAEHLIELSRAGECRVIRLEPPGWVEPPRKPEPWVNPNPRGTVVHLESRAYWYQIFGMLQQGWALVEPLPEDEGVMLYKVRDDSEIYGQQWFADIASAEAFLLFSGYQRFDENPDAWSFLVPPGGPFHLSRDVPAKISPRSQVKAFIQEGLMPLRWHARETLNKSPVEIIASSATTRPVHDPPS